MPPHQQRSTNHIHRSPAPRPVNDDDAVDEDLIATVRAIAECTIDKYRENKALFRVPLQRYIVNSGKISTDAHLISALHTYGQYNGAATAARKPCKPARLRASLQAVAQIGVQPTAIARWRVPLGGRRCLDTGRPTKASYTTEHGYGTTKKPHKTAPYNLLQCVLANMALEKTHSAMIVTQPSHSWKKVALVWAEELEQASLRKTRACATRCEVKFLLW